MIKYNIIDNKKFQYWTDDDFDSVNVNVYELEKLIYSTNVDLNKGIIYFTELSFSWNNKHIDIFNRYTNESISFDIIGLKDSLSDAQKIKMIKYSRSLVLNDNTELCSIMNKNKSDKASKTGDSSGHNYTRYYNTIFNKFKDDDINIFELGLGTNNISVQSNMGSDGFPGASIFGWSEYFQNGHVFGADIDTGCLFNTDKIKTFYCDQTDPYIINQMWDNKYLDIKFDIIIEDGLHTFDANVTFFENSFYKLKKHGIFIIEDINNDEIPNWLDIIEKYETIFPQFNFEIIQLHCDHNIVDNNIIKITYKDNYKNLILYNTGHNGDVHYSREFVKDIIKKLPNKNVEYKNNYDVLKDIDINCEKINDKCDSLSHIFYDDDNLYVNLWLGQMYSYYITMYNKDFLFYSIYLMYKDIYKYLSIDIESIEYYIPDIDFSKLYKKNIDDFMIRYTKNKKILISNGNVLSNQSLNFDFKPIVESLSNLFPNIIFILTKKIDVLKSNVYFTDDIINIESDLNEISYLSTYCDIIIGRESGPSCFAYIKNNIYDVNKTYVVFTYYELTGKFYNNMKADFIWSNKYEKAEEIIKNKLISINE